MDLYMANEVEDRGERIAQHRSIEKSPLNCKFKCRRRRSRSRSRRRSRRLRKRGAVTSPGGQKSPGPLSIAIGHMGNISFLQQLKKVRKSQKENSQLKQKIFVALLVLRNLLQNWETEFHLRTTVWHTHKKSTSISTANQFALPSRLAHSGKWNWATHSHKFAK